ncbi:hypothetical protein [Litoribacterium kuwaitense]|nr:hypothetical protein [Litoribacterium kuwaitense]
MVSFLKKNAPNIRQQASDYGAIRALNATTLALPQMLTYALQDEYLARTL